MQIEFVGDNMKASEIIKTAILASDKKQKDVAEKMGWSQQNFANKLRNNTIDADEWLSISHTLGYELKMVSKNNFTLEIQNRGFYPRAQQIVDGYAYDTEKGTAICRTPKMAGVCLELYKDLPSNRLYIVIYYNWGQQKEFIVPVTEQEAHEFCRSCGVRSSDLF